MSKSTPTLPIHERFHAFQGEGVHAGRSAFFIRLFGCPVKCPWCDSAGTWHKDWIPKQVDRIPIAQLVEEAVSSGVEFVVLTGGEPCVHDLTPLLGAFKNHDTKMPVHLETCGAFRIVEGFDWVTVSPKWDKLPLQDSLILADELKIIVENETSISSWADTLSRIIHGEGSMGGSRRQMTLGQFVEYGVPLWLHPEWSQRDEAKVLNVISQTVKEWGAPYRAGWQLHKLFMVDALDDRTQRLAPLGGDPSKGY